MGGSSGQRGSVRRTTWACGQTVYQPSVALPGSPVLWVLLLTLSSECTASLPCFSRLLCFPLFTVSHRFLYLCLHL